MNKSPLPEAYRLVSEFPRRSPVSALIINLSPFIALGLVLLALFGRGK